MAAPSPLRVLTTLKIPDLKVRISPSIVPLYREQEILSNKFHPRRPRYLALIADTPSDILRWVVSTDLCARALPLSTQRFRLRRRWTGAIVTALRERGLDRKGRLVGRDGGREERVQAPVLRGTVEITVYAGYGAEQSAGVLARQAGCVVEALMKSGLVVQTPGNGKGGVKMDR